MVVCSEPMTSTTVFRSCRLEYGHNGPHRTQDDVWFTERAEHLATIGRLRERVVELEEQAKVLAKQRLTETKCLGCGGTGIRPELGGLDIECHACNGTGKAP